MLLVSLGLVILAGCWMDGVWLVVCLLLCAWMFGFNSVGVGGVGGW